VPLTQIARAGPVNIHENVLRAMNVPGQNHRDPWFSALFKEVLYGTRMLYQTKEGTPFLFPGTGTGAWEASLTNTLSPGDKILTFRCAGWGRGAAGAS
jgi:alanine-glyoxylate transaminase/serine-glyoxylate transaminase/serine-pyruvate transaminase